MVLLGSEAGRHHSFQNVGCRCSPSDTASHLNRPDSSATPLQEPQISHFCSIYSNVLLNSFLFSNVLIF